MSERPADLGLISPTGTQHEVVRVLRVDPPDRVLVDAAGLATSVALFRVAGSWLGIANSCIHRGWPLYDGQLLEEHDSKHAPGTVCVKCPLHGLVLSLSSGRACATPGRGRRVDVFEVRDPADWLDQQMHAPAGGSS